MLTFLLQVVIISQAPDTVQPVIIWEPEKPAWGDTVTVTYHHDAPGALIKGHVPVYGCIDMEKVIAFEQEGNSSRMHFRAPDSASSVLICFYSLEDWDARATLEIMLEKPSGWHSIEEELSEIRNRLFRASSNRYPRDSALLLLDSLRANPLEHPYYYFACIDGFMRLSNSDTAWALLTEMRKKYSGKKEYSNALSSVDYVAYTDPACLSEARKDTLNQWIDDELKRIGFSFLINTATKRWLEDSTSLSKKEREKIIKRFLSKEPLNPMLHSFLAMFYVHEADTASAIREYSRAVEIILCGEVQKNTGDPSLNPATFTRWLENWTLERGKLYAGLKRYDEALADFSFVTLFKRDYEADAYFEQAKVWQRLERYKRAQDYFLKAYSLGNQNARPALEGLHLLNTGSRAGFEEWLGEAMTSQEENLNTTTDFGFKDLEGNAGRWFDYRGKIVVVNVWGIGCGPCKKEIPDLNKLVSDYKNTGVVFLAFTGDSPEALKEYFSEHPFDYANLIITEGQPFMKSFRLPGSIPWHGIIDSSGRIRYHRLGAREDNSDLKLVIDQLLRERTQGK